MRLYSSFSYANCRAVACLLRSYSARSSSRSCCFSNSSNASICPWIASTVSSSHFCQLSILSLILCSSASCCSLYLFLSASVTASPKVFKLSISSSRSSLRRLYSLISSSICSSLFITNVCWILSSQANSSLALSSFNFFLCSIASYSACKRSELAFSSSSSSCFFTLYIRYSRSAFSSAFILYFCCIRSNQSNSS